jgi:predicted GH43/DUF377 family glycosyl hydrolase
LDSDLAQRVGPRLSPDPRRVVGQLFVPGEESPHGRSRAASVLDRLLALDEDEVTRTLTALLASFSNRHDGFTDMLLDHFRVATHGMSEVDSLSRDRQLLIGACFTSEYSAESIALFNPSIAAHPDQSGLGPGELRFVMTVRCLGEGHISSIGFRTGVIGPAGSLSVDEPVSHLSVGRTEDVPYPRAMFVRRMADLGIDPDSVETVIHDLPDPFSDAELATSVDAIHEHARQREPVQRAITAAFTVADSRYARSFAPEVDLSGRLLWPGSAAERHGMEDARLVRFADDDGSVTYCATYTAYDGAAVWTHFWQTTDLRHFAITPLAGKAARNKGLAIFPRRIQGRYMALSRWDRESLAIAASDDLYVWEQPEPLYAPRYGWEAIQLGNGGSPIETPHGWLVLTHGVGPMRVYALGALLLDLHDPRVVLGVLPTPFLTPAEDEREGYVPNVVYTCGALLHDGVLTVPYGISDTETGFAQIALSDLLDRMVAHTS